jgi:hypothetical protein
MTDAMQTTAPDLEDLRAALELLSMDYEDQRAFLPPSGYSQEGVLRECVDGLRDAIAQLPSLLRDGRLAPAAAAEVLACHLFVEALMRDSRLAAGEAFERAPEWAEARALARVAQAALGEGVQSA